MDQSYPGMTFLRPRSSETTAKARVEVLKINPRLIPQHPLLVASRVLRPAPWVDLNHPALIGILKPQAVNKDSAVFRGGSGELFLQAPPLTGQHSWFSSIMWSSATPRSQLGDKNSLHGALQHGACIHYHSTAVSEVGANKGIYKKKTKQNKNKKKKPNC